MTASVEGASISSFVPPSPIWGVTKGVGLLYDPQQSVLDPIVVPIMKLRSFKLALLVFGLLLNVAMAGDLPNEIQETPRQTILQILRAAVQTPFAPARIHTLGTVSFADPHWGKDFFLQDGTGGIMVRSTGDLLPEVGDSLEISGLVAQGDFAPRIVEAKWVNLGKKPLGDPPIASGGGVLNGAYNGERVKIDGWIRSAKLIQPTILQATVISGASRLTVLVCKANSMDAKSLVGKKFAAIGVASAVNARGITRHLVDVQILVANPRDISFNSLGSYYPAEGEITPFMKIFQFRPSLSRGEQLRVRGMMMYRREETLFLNDGESGLVVKAVNPIPLERGEWVEAVGFCDLEEFQPSLADAVVTRISAPKREVKPKECAARELFQGHQHANYVSVQGQLLDQVVLPRKSPRDLDGKKLSLTLQSPEGVFAGELCTDSVNEPLPALEVGSILQLTGICMVDTDEKGNPVGFKVLIPSGEEIAVVKPASFFNAKRLLAMLCAALLVLLVVVLRTVAVTRKNAELVAGIRERNAVASERSRLARDLHDTLEQGLTGISLHIQSIGKATETVCSENARESIEATRRLVKQCHSELRQSIWDLRSPELGDFDLGDALKRMAESLVSGLDIQIDFRPWKNAVRLPSMVEDNLLRIGQESITNAIKNAGASRITIELAMTPELATMTITDNGRGFAGEIDFRPKEGHYGIQGMRERAQRIGGQLTISKSENGGCVVQVSVPISQNSPSSVS